MEIVSFIITIVTTYILYLIIKYVKILSFKDEYNTITISRASALVYIIFLIVDGIVVSWLLSCLVNVIVLVVCLLTLSTETVKTSFPPFIDRIVKYLTSPIVR